MPAFLRPTVQTETELKFAARTYMGALAFAVLGAGALSAAYVMSSKLGRLYFLAWAVLCFLGAVWRLFWRDDLAIDISRRSFVRRRGHWPKVRVQLGSLEDIAAVTLADERRQDSRGGLIDVWVVGLRFESTADPLMVAEFLKSEPRAREYARVLACRLQRPLAESPRQL